MADETTIYSAKHWAAKAAKSATAAAGSKADVAANATAAATSAQTASEKAENAASSATSAAASATAAAGKATQAATSATNAGQSETAAAASATNAANSATAASSSATSAQTAQTKAQALAAKAAASAQEAAQSAQEAAQSAQNSRGLAIGQLVWSQSSLAKDNPGCLPCWTGEYYTNASTLYPDFYAWVKRHPELCKTKAEYDAAITTYGECPYYVADEVSGSLRLPKLANYIKMANSTEGITQKGAGLPNITGSARVWHASTSTGAFAGTNDNAIGRGGGNERDTGIVTFDASRSSSIYGASDTVQPAHTTLYPWVCAFNAAVPASTAQAAEFTAALAGKANADLSNLSAAGKNIASGLGMPSNRYIDLTLGASGATYTAPANGWVLVGKRCTANQYLGTCANSIMKCLEVWNSSYCSLFFPVRKGDVFPISYTASGTTEVFRFIYAEGAE